VPVDVDPPATPQRILDATVDVLARRGPRKLSLSDVAAAAGVSRPTLYRWFPSKDALLDAFGEHEQARFDDGLATAIAGLDGEARLDAVLRFIVAYQRSSSLRRVADVEPDHVLRRMREVMPTMRDRLLPHFSGPDAAVVASVVARIGACHALVPDDDPAAFLAELRLAAGLAHRR